MQIIIKQVDNQFRVYFDEIHPAYLCSVCYSVGAAQRKARSLLKAHGEKITNITYMLKEN